MSDGRGRDLSERIRNRVGRLRGKLELRADQGEKRMRRRASVLLAASGTALALLVSRYAYLSIWPGEMRELLRSKASKQFETELILAPARADIVDRNGHLLATSVMQPSLFVLPRKIPVRPEAQKRIARQLDVPYAQIAELAKGKKNRAWLKRQITHAQLEKLGDLAPFNDFLGVVEEPKRVYPERELAAHLIGFAGIDNSGLEGIELAFEQRLNGRPANVIATRDARGRLTLITPGEGVRPDEKVKALRLSLDVSIQDFTEQALRQGVADAKAKGGSAVVLDIETGELLAIASYPTFDLNQPQSAGAEQRRFRTVRDALELGSVVKPLFVAQALDRNAVKPNELLDCENGRYAIPGGVIHDDHPHKFLTPSDVIKFSSNICTYKMAQRVGRQAVAEMLVRVGLARGPGTGLPGEWLGRIAPHAQWREMRFANLAFGQGIAISPLQLTKALASLTGGGEDVALHLLAREENDAHETAGPPLRLFSAHTSRIVTRMMQSVVEEEGGTGKKASIPGITVAGKTGTAQKFDPATKSYSERISTFIGVLPAERPRIAITVVIDEPKVRPAYGGLLAGPVFAEIGAKTINYLNAVGVLALESNQPAPL